MHRNTYYKNRYNKISVVKRSFKNIKSTYRPNMKHLKTLISTSIIDIHHGIVTRCMTNLAVA